MTPAQIRAYKRAATLICAEMIESARRAGGEYEEEFGAGYQQAKRELAEMLRLVARGEIPVEVCREVFGEESR